MIDLGMTPERLPTDPEKATPGRFAARKKRTHDDEVANPDSLLDVGVFIPPTDDEKKES